MNKKYAIVLTTSMIIPLLGPITIKAQGNGSTFTIEEKVTGQWEKLDDGSWMYRDSNGDYLKNKMVAIDDNTYYFDSEGIMYKGWIQLNVLNKSWYFFDGAGHMKTGWLKQGKDWYYFSNSGIMQTGWIDDKGQVYYLTSSGVMAASQWIHDQDEWFYVDNSGAVKKGWLLLNGEWYYLKQNGVMARDETIDGYIFGSNGICLNPNK